MAPGFRQKVKRLFKGSGSKHPKAQDGENDFNATMLPLLRARAAQEQSVESYIALALLGDEDGKQELERKIKAKGIQRPGESMQVTVDRLKEEYVKKYQDMEPQALAVPRGPDRITDLIFNGSSSKPRTDASGPNATANDRSVAYIESALENMWKPKPQTHQTTQLDTSNLREYNYRPLKEPRSIRLLRFHEDDLLLPTYAKQKVCTIEIFALSEAPPYLTVSYAWQAPKVEQECVEAYKENREWIVVGEDGEFHRMNVGRNLYEALQRITQAKSTVRYVWIDAFCINQKDDVEKASSVAFMDAVYSGCQRVLVWLGEMDPREAASIYVLHFEILPEMVKYIQKHGGQAIQTGDWTMDELIERFGLGRPMAQMENWKSYRNLFQNYMWFTRAWVVQEIALPPDAVVMFAHLSIPFADMVLLARFLSVSGLVNSLLEVDGSPKRRPGAMLEVFQQSQQWAKSMRNPEGIEELVTSLGLTDAAQLPWTIFSRCIELLRDQQSKFAHDRIYAALGFLHLDQKNTNIIVPNYQLPLRVLFTNVTAILLQKLPNFSILTQRESDVTDRVPGLPSWVPDYSLSQGKQPFNQSLYDPSGTFANTLNFRILHSKLVLRGVALDTVSAIHQLGDFSSQTNEMMASAMLLKTGLDAVRHLIQTPKWWAAGDLLEVLWKTLVANHTNTPGEPTLDSSHFCCFMAQTSLDLSEALKSLGRAANPERMGEMFTASPSKPSAELFNSLQEAEARVKTSLYAPTADVELLDSVQSKAVIFVNTAIKFVFNRQLFVTQDGYVGLGPKLMRLGDRIVYVEGARVLFVMRENGHEYELVGETYVHARMQGELYDAGCLDDLREIVLC